MTKETILENIWASISDALNLSSEKKEEVKEEPKVELAEETKEGPVKEEAPVEAYVTLSAFDAFKTEMLSMFKSIMEEKQKNLKEVPQELSKEVKEEVKEEVELSAAQEIVHSPENEVERAAPRFEQVDFSTMTALERIQYNLNRK